MNMNELSQIIFVCLQLVLWPVIIIIILFWLRDRLFPKNKGLKRMVQLVMIKPFKFFYNGGRWIIVKIFTTQPDYRLQQIYLENFPVTPVAFYEAVEEVFRERQIIGAQISRISQLEWHLLSTRRIYLAIQFRDAVCLIGAMPMGTSFLVSWRYTTLSGKTFLILVQIPILGALFEGLIKPPTFYRTDVYYAFEQIVRSTLLETTNLIVHRGIQPLAENEQRPLHRGFYE